MIRKEKNTAALKEWAVVVKALEEGWQILLLRKGGIAEEAGEFVVEEPEFFLYPTYEHQAESLLQPAFHEELRRVAASAPPAGHVVLRSYATVEEVLVARNLGRLRALTGHFIWNEAYLEDRFAYRRENPLYVLLLRVYRLPQPLDLPVLRAYGGCRSWVELAEPLPTRGAVPVLAEGDFQRLLAQHEAALR